MSASSPTITGTVSVFTLRIFVISISRSLYFEIFSVTFVEEFWSDGTDTSGAYHLTENVGNSGWKVNDKVTFRKFQPKIEEYVLR